jgi:hypothetical protein
VTKRLTALFMILAAGACSRTPAPQAGELRVIPLGGPVSLVEAGETTLLEEATTVDAGVSIITEAGGRAKVELPGRRSLELAPETELRVDRQSSEVSEGSVLVRTGSPMMLHAAGSQIEATDATFRIERLASASVRLGTYSGSATVLGSGVPAVTALRQVTVLPGGEALGLQALDVRRNDPWDAELLGQAIDLGLRLQDYERGLSRQLPSGRETGRVSQMLESRFPPRAIKSAVASLGSARAVVAAVVAQEAGLLEGSSPTRILARIVGFIQLLQASWIAVAAEWGLPAAAAALTQNLRDLAGSISELVAPPPAPSLSSSPSSTPGSTPGSGGGGPNGGSDPPGGGGPGGNGGNQDPPPPPPPDQDDPGEDTQPDPQSCADTVECAVEDILEPPGSPGVG